jgi:tRNA dimethylallyltransferase
LSPIPKLIVIEGPTASGKTALGIALAKHFNTVVVSADSRQFYRETAIGTAKPGLEEQDGIRHYFVDSHSIHEPLTAARYEQEALAVLETAFQHHEIVLMVGGSGMFIDAVCYGLDNIPHDAAVKALLNAEFEQNGLEPLLVELQVADPVFHARVDLQNPVRIIRALEVIRITGQPFSDFHAFTPQQRPFEILKFVIDLPREVLYDRINRRVDLMLQQGLLAEVESLVPFKQLQSLNTVGYSELFDYLAGQTDIAEATALIQRNTRRYAKRQLTWFRRDEKAVWMPETELDQQVAFIVSRIDA